jgi:LPXTG-motif cell wall-anchored protein
MTKHTPHQRVRAVGLGTLVLGVIVAVTGLTTASAGAAPSGKPGAGSITICHRTNAPSNPYRVVTVSFDASNGQLQGPDHTGHAGPVFDFSADPADPGYPYTTPRSGDQWGDIIPAYSWSGGSYPGMNWVDGEAIWEAGCNVAAPEVGSITLDKVTAGDGQPADTTSFAFSVDCEDATVPEAAPEIAPADPVALVATDVAVETTCTIGEDAVTDPGFVSTTFSVDGGPAVSGPVTVGMTNAEQTIAIVVTNTYECVAPNTPDGEGGCVPPVVVVDDACPTVDGVQTDTTLCPPVVEGNVITPTTIATVTAAPAQVAGVQVVRAAELPRTGAGTSRAALLGIGFLLLGAGALLVGREQTATA